MAKRGKPKPKGMKGGKGGLAGLLGKGQQLAGGIPGGMGGYGRGSGRLVRVYADGSMVQISKPRRRKGYRMPAAVREQLRASTEQTRALSQAVILAAMK